MQPESKPQPRILAIGAVALAISLASVAFDNPNTQDSGLIIPYFSGAANHQWGRGWQYDRGEIETFVALPSRGARESYRFKTSENLEA